MTTITVATYLVANRNVSADAITALTRTLFQERQAVSGEAPIANLIKAASTEKDAVYPLHPGAKVYYGGEETSLMERYGDWLFYGPMLAGALGSGFLVLLRFLGFRDDQDQTALLARIREVIASIKEARTPAELDAIRARRRRRGRAARRERRARRIRRAANGRALSRHQLHRSPYRRAAGSSAERPGRELLRACPGSSRRGVEAAATCAQALRVALGEPSPRVSDSIKSRRQLSLTR